MTTDLDKPLTPAEVIQRVRKAMAWSRDDDAFWRPVVERIEALEAELERTRERLDARCGTPALSEGNDKP